MTKSVEEILDNLQVSTLAVPDSASIINVRLEATKDIEAWGQKRFEEGHEDCKKAGDPTNHVHFKEATDRLIAEARKQERQTVSKQVWKAVGKKAVPGLWSEYYRNGYDDAITKVQAKLRELGLGNE